MLKVSTTPSEIVMTTTSFPLDIEDYYWVDYDYLTKWIFKIHENKHQFLTDMSFRDDHVQDLYNNMSEGRYSSDLVGVSRFSFRLLELMAAFEVVLPEGKVSIIPTFAIVIRREDLITSSFNDKVDFDKNRPVDKKDSRSLVDHAFEGKSFNTKQMLILRVECDAIRCSNWETFSSDCVRRLKEVNITKIPNAWNDAQKE